MPGRPLRPPPPACQPNPSTATVSISRRCPLVSKIYGHRLASHQMPSRAHTKIEFFRVVLFILLSFHAAGAEFIRGTLRPSGGCHHALVHLINPASERPDTADLELLMVVCVVCLNLSPPSEAAYPRKRGVARVQAKPTCGISPSSTRQQERPHPPGFCRDCEIKRRFERLASLLAVGFGVHDAPQLRLQPRDQSREVQVEIVGTRPGRRGGCRVGRRDRRGRV